RGPLFTYDLTGAPTTQEGALAEFLFESHRGYCEQFASAMTVLVRLLGLPARVAIGFVPGEQQADGSYLITNRQAHAWPEVWFPSVGWVSFEPTRRSDGATAAPSYAPAGIDDPDGAAAPPGQESESGAQPLPEPVPMPVPSAGANPEDPTATHSPTAGQDTDTSPGIPAWVIWLCATVPPVAALLATPAIIRFRRRRARLRAGRPEAGAGTAGAGAPGRTGAQGVDQVHDAWAELLDVASDLGITIRVSDSPRAGVARLTAYLDAEPAPARRSDPAVDRQADPEAAAQPTDPEADPTPAARSYPQAREALARLAAAEERARYAPPELAAPPPHAEVRRDVAIASGTLWAVAPRTRRIMARLAPPSVFRRREPDEPPREGATGRLRRYLRRRPTDTGPARSGDGQRPAAVNDGEVRVPEPAHSGGSAPSDGP
ncbi:transglutaminase domain-containing protein, partial [Frankia sp. AvcI1]